MENNSYLASKLQDRFNQNIDGITFKHVKNGRQAFDLEIETIDTPTGFISLQAYGKDTTADSGILLNVIRTFAITLITLGEENLADYVDLIIENIQTETYLTDKTSIELDSATAFFNNEKEFFTITINLISEV